MIKKKAPLKKRRTVLGQIPLLQNILITYSFVLPLKLGHTSNAVLIWNHKYFFYISVPSLKSSQEQEPCLINLVFSVPRGA